METRCGRKLFFLSLNPEPVPPDFTYSLDNRMWLELQQLRDTLQRARGKGEELPPHVESLEVRCGGGGGGGRSFYFLSLCKDKMKTEKETDGK